MQRKIKAELIDIKEFSPNVHMYSFKPLNRIPKFNSGQFLHLALDEYDPSYNWPESRVFSIASSPEQQNQIDILVSSVGVFTNRMKNELNIGNTVWLKMPFGDFNFKETEGRDCVLIAGGTGISPFISFLKSINKRNKFTYLAYGVKESKLLIIDQLIRKLNIENEFFESDIFIEDGNYNSLEFLKGKLNIERIIEKSKNFSNVIYYLSGPPSMIKAFYERLLANKINENNIKFDNWE